MAAALLLPLLVVPNLGATTLVPMDDADLVATSRVVVVGHVRRLETLALADGSVVTEIVLTVEQRIKGRTPGSKLVVTEPGGVIGDREVRVFGAPDFALGERVLVFLKPTGAGRLRTNALALGKYSLDADRAIRGQPVPERRATRPFLERIAALASREPVPGRGGNGRSSSTPVVSRTAAPRFTLLGSPPTRWSEHDIGLLQANGDAALGSAVSTSALAAALAAWNTAPGVDLHLFRAGAGGTGASIAGGACDARSVVQFNDPHSELSDMVGCTGLVAVGGFCRRPGTTVVGGVLFGRIAEADVTVNSGVGACFGEVGLREVLTHEIGHAIGLGHSSAILSETNPRRRDATMFPLLHFDGRGAALRDDDSDGVRAVYPALPGTPDADQDGVADATDTCPDTPDGSIVDSDGCACSQPGHVACDDGDTCTIDQCEPTAGRCRHAHVVCDDGDPCTSDRCDPSLGCQHAPIDTDGDGRCDALDPCPRLAGADETDANGDGIGEACQCAERLPGRCIPSRGTPRTRCRVEWRPLDTSALVPSLLPSRLACRDGDPTCDHDGVPGQCTFQVLLCINLRDPRFPACTPGRTRAVRIVAPRRDRARNAIDRANAAALAAGLVLDRRRENQCSAPLGLIVPTRGNRAGARRVSVRTETAAGPATARLLLRCLP